MQHSCVDSWNWKQSHILRDILLFILRANEEIAEVRSKNKAESSALQAQLRREQLKVQSLEKSLDQKVG